MINEAEVYLIDTDVISDARKGDKANAGVRAFFKDAARDDTALYLSAITVGGLRQGVERIRHRDDRPRDRNRKIKKIADHLGKQAKSKSHNRHINPDVAESLGLNVVGMENDQTLQDCVLSLHHAFTITMTQTAAVKIIENHKGTAYVSQAQVIQQQKPS